MINRFNTNHLSSGVNFAASGLMQKLWKSKGITVLVLGSLLL